MEARLRQSVRQRAKNRCEYCRLHQDFEPLRFHIEHIIPRQHGGKDSSENLALACHHAIVTRERTFQALIQKQKNSRDFFIHGSMIGRSIFQRATERSPV